MAIVQLLDPFRQVRESIPAGDGEHGEVTVLSVALWRLGEGFDIPDKVGLHELNCFVVVIQLLLVFGFLGCQILLEAMGACL